ncbi:MAG TPA: hypothetical protein VK877_00015, partial [Pseudolabrys sp.]|nr:hypothetical protein [Pseudolabrys sp.]
EADDDAKQQYGLDPGTVTAPESALSGALSLVFVVMAGLVPAIHVLLLARCEDVDARDKRGHDIQAATMLGEACTS